jgi:putative acetyltransferase
MIVIRAETSEDIPAVRRVNELAFGRPGEADLVDALRALAISTVSLVAVLDGNVVGHLFFSPVTLEVAIGEDSPALGLALGLGPLAVLPEFQNQGIGSRLVREGLEACRQLGAGAVVVLGHPEFYPRFGFVPASRFGLRCEYPVPDDVFMALELRPRAFSAPGLIKYHPAFAGV